MRACLAFSAVFEMLEWAAAVTGGQWDMFCALIGATVSVLSLSRPHDRQLDGLRVTSSYSGAGSTGAARTSTAGTRPPLP